MKGLLFIKKNENIVENGGIAHNEFLFLLKCLKIPMYSTRDELKGVCILVKVNQYPEWRLFVSAALRLHSGENGKVV